MFTSIFPLHFWSFFLNTSYLFDFFSVGFFGYLINRSLFNECVQISLFKYSYPTYWETSGLNFLGYAIVWRIRKTIYIAFSYCFHITWLSCSLLLHNEFHFKFLTNIIYIYQRLWEIFSKSFVVTFKRLHT